MSVTRSGHDQKPPERQKLGHKPTETQKKKTMSKAAMRRFYGNPEFHYMQTCTHDVKRKGMCSFCKLIEKEAVAYLQEEQASKHTQRLHGFYRRSEMRYGLIREWSKNQLFRLQDSLPTHSAEIALCARLGDSIGHFEDINQALDNIAQNLRKRNRVLEVGHFAAILIQAKIRGHLARKRMRHYMLTRFHFFAANTRRKAYYFDDEKGSRWKMSPVLIKNERPVSPSTMSRRLRSEEKKCDQHMINYENACKRNDSYLHERRGGLWKVLEEDATMIRQMIILRDVIYCVLKRLSTIRREKGERPTNKQSILPLGGPKGPHPSQVQPPATARNTDDAPPPEMDENGDVIPKNPKKLLKKKSNRYKRGESTGDGLIRSESTASVGTDGGEDAFPEGNKETSYDYSKNLTELKPSMSAFPYWFSFSNPAPPMRQIYLTLAIKTPPLPMEVIVELSPEEIQAKLKAEKATKVVITAEALESKRKKSRKSRDAGHVEVVDEEEDTVEDNDDITEEEREILEKKKNPNALTLNERFQFLDKRIWNQMICFDAEDMLRKISLSEDVHPAVSSGVGIAEDTHRVWCGDIGPSGDIPGIKARGLKVIGDSDDESSIQYSATDTESEGEGSEPSSSPRVNLSRQASSNNLQQTEEPINEGSLIPIQLQIHPFFMHRTPSNMFRLFFIEGKLRAVCHSSPWTYYADMFTYRASVVKTIANYSRSAACTEILKSITAQSKEKFPKRKKEKSHANLLTAMPSLKRMGSVSLNEPEDERNGSCLSIRVPDEKVLFDGIPEMKGSALTSKEYKKVEEKYKFVKRMFSWKKYKRNTKRHVDLVPLQAEEPALTPEELLRQESIATQFGGGDSDKKMAVIPPGDELMGSTIYQLCCGEVPQDNLSTAAKEKITNYKGANGYRSLLRMNVNSGETLMEHCMALPESNEHSQDLEPEVTPHPDFNLIVLEVHLKDIRAEEEEKQRKLEEEAGIKPAATGAKDDPSSGRRASTLRGGGRLPPMKGKKKGKAKYEVRTPLIELQAELHQIVGTFSTFSERAPAAIDTGMFDWSEMKAFGAPPPPVVAVEEVEERTEERAPEEMTAFQMTAIEKQRKTVPVWKSYSLSPGSGIYTYNISMTTARTQQAAPDDQHIIEFRLLGKRPTREYLQGAIPLKIRKWLGMKY